VQGPNFNSHYHEKKVECLPSKCKNLRSNPTTIKKEEEEKEEEEEEEEEEEGEE
jgi:hypothetical protein